MKIIQLGIFIPRNDKMSIVFFFATAVILQSVHGEQKLHAENFQSLGNVPPPPVPRRQASCPLGDFGFVAHWAMPSPTKF